MVDVAPEVPPARLLAGTSCCLRCAKQLKTGGIFCSRPGPTRRCFRCAKNNDSCLPVPIQFKGRLSVLQALADSVNAGEAPLALLEKEGKKWVSEVENYLRKASPKKGRASVAVAGAPETGRLLEKISLQLEQMTEVFCHMVEEEFGGGEVVEE
ncbi:hypothetical protein EMCG_07335 [[Emmonsia] crescens]|uniref:Uncharacterized protein n=1 Tax=[Emmonsia] crescens TaxID=73230 RepID=A0A0G2I8P0_9EURO|nr:hypothetical protein EMCG_07335 [Emmonsia crescens UAMH 3008]